MNVTLIAADNSVEIDGVVYTVPLDLNDIASVNYNTVSGVGWATYTDGTVIGIGKMAYIGYEKYVTQALAQNAQNITLEQAKHIRKEQINSIRDNIEQSGFPFMGKSLDSDKVSVSRINTVVNAAFAALQAGQDFNITWTCQDNTELTLNATQIVNMPIALAVYANQLHTHAKTLKTAIDAATTLAELESISWA